MQVVRISLTVGLSFSQLFRCNTYYRAINDIIDLDCYADLRFFMLTCHWFEGEQDKYCATINMHGLARKI